MDLDEYKKLQAETESYRNNIENIGAEKIALDRQYVKKLQEAIQLETECVKKDTQINKLNDEIASLKDELSRLKDNNVTREIAELLPEACS